MKPLKLPGDTFGSRTEGEGFRVVEFHPGEKPSILIKGLTYVKPELLLAFVEWYYGGKLVEQERPVPDAFFIKLNAEEESEYRQWARDNFEAGQPASPAWHPVVRDEWSKLVLDETRAPRDPQEYLDREGD